MKFTATRAASGVIFTQRMREYNSINVQVVDIATSNTITFETSNDRTTWVSCMGISPAAALGAPVATLAANGHLSFPKMGAYFRARISTYGSGTVSVACELSKAAVNPFKVAAS